MYSNVKCQVPQVLLNDLCSLEKQFSLVSHVKRNGLFLWNKLTTHKTCKKRWNSKIPFRNSRKTSPRAYLHKYIKQLYSVSELYARLLLPAHLQCWVALCLCRWGHEPDSKLRTLTTVKAIKNSTIKV